MDDDDFRMESKQGVAWMITFTDLVSLMLTFFVLLFSMSNIKVDRWNDVIDALSQSLNPSSTKAEASATSSFNIETLFRKRAINLDYLASVLTDATSKDELLMNSRLLRMEDRLVIALPGDLLFEPGKAVLNDG
ncbi:MAG: chemotaxis protein MotB, partial [Rhodospirillaceae bacterium]|nr:chemotaxis protein MotB [Rhodospirillaceae bacterium]